MSEDWSYKCGLRSCNGTLLGRIGAIVYRTSGKTTGSIHGQDGCHRSLESDGRDDDGTKREEHACLGEPLEESAIAAENGKLVH